MSWQQIETSLATLDVALRHADLAGVEVSVTLLSDLLSAEVRADGPPASGEPPPPEVLERVPRLLDKIGRLMGALDA
ncbi:CATRA system-associated protein [Streptomyces sp. NPDC093272]|uniref:CATRA system-associated protein n=1 Tax=unclassified Streptomyces TaxID=2593676 RepID=UPI00343F4073